MRAVRDSLPFPNVDRTLAQLSPANTCTLLCDAGILYVSENGAAYTPVSTGAVASGWQRVGTTISEIATTDQVAMGAAAAPAVGSKAYVQGTANPGATDATLRVRAFAGQTGDVERVETSAAAALRRLTIDGDSVITRDVVAGRDVTAVRNVTAVQGFFENAAPSSAFGTESLTASQAAAGGATGQNAFYAEVQQLSGAETVGISAEFILARTLTNSSNIALAGSFINTFHGGTGAVTALSGMFILYGADQTSTAALGAVTAAAGLTISGSATAAGGSTSAFTAMTAISIAAPGADATHTIATAKGINIANQGKAGVTNAVGIDIAAQSGAATTNLALRSAGVIQTNSTFIEISGPIAAPAAPAAGAYRMFVDAADGLLKTKGSGGTLTNIGAP